MTAAIGVCAFAPFLGLAYAALLFVGWASVSFIAIGNSTIQLSAEPGMRGRVIALWQVAFQGTTPVGGVVLARRYRRAQPPKAMQPESPASARPVPAEAPAS